MQTIKLLEREIKALRKKIFWKRLRKLPTSTLVLELAKKESDLMIFKLKGAK